MKEEIGDNKINVIEMFKKSVQLFKKYLKDTFGEDGFDENERWHSRIGDDYISVAGRLYGTSATNPVPFGEGAVFNTGNFSMVTQTDYCVKGYTVQAVGKFAGSGNSSAAGMNLLIAFNMGASPMIGIFGDGSIQCANGSNLTHQQTYPNLTQKIFNASLNLSFAPTRNGTSGLNHLYSVNGGPWYTTTAANSGHNSKGANMTVLCYYSDSYRSIGAKLYSLRVYNRKLTEEELQHNFEIDKARFGIE